MTPATELSRFFQDLATQPRWRQWSWLCWLGILIPLCIENYWDIRIFNYDIRFQYLAVAAMGLALLLAGIKMQRNLWLLLKEYAREPAVLALLIMMTSALLAGFNTENLKRFAFIWLWSFGTFIVLPLIVRGIFYSLREWLYRSLAWVLLLHSSVILIDFIFCQLRLGLQIARVTLQGGACRPHGWYREPAFFAVFALTNLLWIRLKIHQQKGHDHRLYLVTYAFLSIAIVLCTSRAGWAGLALLLFTEVIYFIYNSNFAWLQSLRNPKVIATSVLSLFLLGWGVSEFSKTRSYDYTLYTIRRVLDGTDGSLRNRNINFDAHWVAFKDHPLVGVGTGTIGAYLVAKHPEHPALHFDFALNDGFTVQRNIPREQRLEISRNNSYSNSVMGELLAEWGLIGSMALVLAWYWMFKDVFVLVRWQIVLLGSFLCVMWQTLQRFDMWLAFILISLLSRQSQWNKLERL